MSDHDPLITLRQMADFITEAQALVIGKSLDGILDDPVLLRAFERLMELVGESAKRLPVDLRDRYPEVPWCKVAGMRDVISHAYEDLSYEILWDALQIQFPQLLSTVKRMISDLQG
jgi:uncharacterized protein with HEPN domain